MQNEIGINHAGNNLTLNRNAVTGIRFGVISCNAVDSDALEVIWERGTDVNYARHVANVKANLRSVLEGCVAKVLLDATVEAAFDAVEDEVKEAFPEPSGFARYLYSGEGYKLRTNSDGELWVLDSEFFTYAQHCSPCAPGACHLLHPLEGTVEDNKTYCLHPSWFHDDCCAYDVYSVETGELLLPRRTGRME